MKIGILSPASGFYPYIGVDFYEGLKLNLPPEVVLIEEETNTASPTEIQVAARKLILKDNVDLITGWIGYKSITALLPLIQQTKTPLIMCNAGAMPLIRMDKNPYVVHCSLKLFDVSYLITKWAVKNFGQEYSRLVSFFDAGYPFSYAASLASNKYKGRINQTEIVRNDNGTEIRSYLDKVFEKEVSFIFSSFSGWDAVEMMKSLDNYPGLPDTPFVSVSMFTDHQVLDQAGVENIYSINTWMHNSNNIVREKLEGHFKNTLHRNLSPFGILGYESGLIIMHCLNNNWKPKTEIESLLTNSDLNSPRGSMKFNPAFNNFFSHYFLYRTMHAGVNGCYRNALVEEIIPEQEDERILDYVEEESSGWLNTYLCV